MYEHEQRALRLYVLHDCTGFNKNGAVYYLRNRTDFRVSTKYMGRGTGYDLKKATYTTNI